MLVNVQDVASERAVPPRAQAPPPTTAEVRRPPPPRQGVAAAISAELLAGLRTWPIWMVLGWDDIRQRYRRSVIGPFWITLSMGIFILLLGVIYSRLFHTDIRTYIPFLSAGLTVWAFIAQNTNEGCLAFAEGARIIKQIKLPYSIYILRIVWRNLIIFLHTVAIFIPVALIFRVPLSLATLLVVPGLVLVCINVTWVALLLSILSTRFRDMQPIVATLVQIAMFTTPIMWPVESLSDGRIIAEINPLYHLIDIVRAPMLGTAPEPLSWLVAGGVALLGWALATAIMVAKHRRIVFWL